MVRVMRIRYMRVTVLFELVPVPVAVRACGHWIVRMVMVAIVVSMRSKRHGP